MDSKLKSLFHDPAYYVKCFNIYAALSSKYNVLAQWVENVFSDAVVDKLRVKLGSQEELRVLGVGSGSGEVDFKMLIKLLRQFPRISNRVVEPAEDQLVQYKALVDNKAHELHGVTCDWRQQTIDEYEKAGDGATYHLISAVHSLYYANDVEDVLKYLYARLEPGGMILIILVSDDSGFWRLWNRFSHLQDNLMHFFNSAIVRSILDRREIPYAIYHQRVPVKITQCFDDASEDGRMMVDFLTHIHKLHETATKELRKEVIEYLASSDCSEKTSEGEVLFNADWDAVVLNKPT